MGHSSSIAYGIALQKPNQKVWCIDGDGAAIMHMGAMATIGNSNIENLIHIAVNNEAHESVGGFKTAAVKTDYALIAKACGYSGRCGAHGTAGGGDAAVSQQATYLT